MSTINLASLVDAIVRQQLSIFSTRGSKGLKFMLKTLYCLICSYSSHDTQDGLGTRSAEYGSILSSENTVILSSILFEELHSRLSFSSPKTSTDEDAKGAVAHFDTRGSVEELLLLFRCCVLMLRLHPRDLILMERFKDFVALHHLLPFGEVLTVTQSQRGSVGLTEVFSSQSMNSRCNNLFFDDLSGKSSSSYICLLKQMLEVLLDEMFADKPLRECIAVIDSLCSMNGNHSICSSEQHLETVLDAIATHFLLTVSGEQDLSTFTQSLNWMRKRKLSTPELRLTVAISLVRHPVFCSSILLHAHAISLVSEVIDISTSVLGTSRRCTEIYLSAFDDSVILYCWLLSKLLSDSCSNPHEEGKTVKSPFKPRLFSKIYDKVDIVLSDWENSWRLHINNVVNKTSCEMASDAISYLNMYIGIFDESSRDGILSFLSSLVRVISIEVDEVLLCRFKEMTMQDCCLLASILKLMSCSMLQAACCLRENSRSLNSSSKNNDAFPGCRSLFSVMSSLRGYNLHLPIQVQRLVVDAMKPHCSSSEETNVILIHFAGLLSLCTATRLDFLVRGCLFMMMIIMDVLIFEERTSEILRSSVAHEKPIGETREDHAHQMSSRRLASAFKRMRKLFVRKPGKTTNGVPYLESIFKDCNLIAEFADFIECKEGRDYTAYVEDRARLRYKISKKNRRWQWKRKKLVYSYMGTQNRSTRRTCPILRDHSRLKT